MNSTKPSNQPDGSPNTSIAYRGVARARDDDLVVVLQAEDRPGMSVEHAQTRQRRPVPHLDGVVSQPAINPSVPSFDSGALFGVKASVLIHPQFTAKIFIALLKNLQLQSTQPFTA